MFLKNLNRPAAALLSAAFILAFAVPVSAHVGLDSPNGGESYRPGRQVMIMWHPIVDHSTVGWSLEYSVTGTSGPWIPIALNLPAGNTAAGTIHTFLWTVPNINAAAVWVRVQQVNPGQDYYDTSNAPFEIKDALAGNTANISVSLGGTLMLDIDAGSDLGGSIFTVLGNFTGTQPGIPYQGWTIPLNQDFYFDRTLLIPNFAPLSNSLGLLDSSGLATTTFTLAPGELDPSTVGVVINHAAVVVDTSFQVDLVSNAVSVILVP